MDGEGNLVTCFDQGTLACTQCLVEGEVEWLDGYRSRVMIIFITTLLAISIDVIIDQEGIVVGLVGIGIHIDLRVAGIIRGSSDLCPVGDHGIGSHGAVDRQDHIGAGAGTRSQGARQGECRCRACQVPTGVVGRYKRHLSRDIVSQQDIASGNGTLVGHGNGEGHLVTGFDGSRLADGQLLDQSQVKGFDNHRSAIVIVFVSAILAVTVNIVVFQEEVVVDIIRVGIDIGL